MVDQNQLKKQAAIAALEYVEEDMVVGIGTGSTVHYFIEALAEKKHLIQGTVASSKDSEEKLKHFQIPVLSLNSCDVDLYVDGADEFNAHRQLIKGGGGAHTKEKIIAYSARSFVCIVDASKQVEILGEFPLPVEVLPMARSSVARELVKLGGNPVYREDFITDQGNHILDVYHLDFKDPLALENTIKSLTGVVENGIFARHVPEVILMAQPDGIHRIQA